MIECIIKYGVIQKSVYLSLIPVLFSSASLLDHPRLQRLPLAHGPEFDQELLCFPKFPLTLEQITITQTYAFVQLTQHKPEGQIK